MLAITGCSSDKQATSKVAEEELAARVNDWTFTREELRQIIDSLNDLDKLKYDTPGGKAELTDEVIQEELYYQEGLKVGLDEDEMIRDAVEKYERSLVLSQYFDKHIKPLAYPSEQEMHDHYEENIERFTRQPIARAQHIMVRDNPDRLLEFKAMVESGDEKFTTLAHKFSQDITTQTEGGDLGYFNPGGYMRGIGYSDELSNTAFSLEVGQISAPIKWEKGWSILVLTELRPPVVRPFDEVRQEIKDAFWVMRKDKVKQVAFDELSKGYKVDNYLADAFALISRTPEELWNLAQNSQDSYDRLRYYEEVVERYPESEHAAKAQFMIGFVFAEELQDFVSADRAFTRVLNEYPESEVAESAKYMLETMNKPGAPKLGDPDEAEGDAEDSNG